MQEVNEKQRRYIRRKSNNWLALFSCFSSCSCWKRCCLHSLSCLASSARSSDNLSTSVLVRCCFDESSLLSFNSWRFLQNTYFKHFFKYVKQIQHLHSMETFSEQMLIFRTYEEGNEIMRLQHIFKKMLSTTIATRLWGIKREPLEKSLLFNQESNNVHEIWEIYS